MRLANGIILKSKTATEMECLRDAHTLPASVVITDAASRGEFEPAIAFLIR